jgi:catechol 2,3-dioxygenase-like lactoylglutathione lyase family enzyme
MKVTGLHHILLTVRDLERSTAFYTEVLGLQKVKEIPDDGSAGAKVLCGLPDGRLLGLVQHRANGGGVFDEFRTGLDHVDHSPPAPSAFGDPLIVLRDPDQIQLQIYGTRSDHRPGDARPTSRSN